MSLFCQLFLTVSLLMAVPLAADVALLTLAVVTLAVGALHDAGRAPAVSTPVTVAPAVAAALGNKMS